MIWTAHWSNSMKRLGAVPKTSIVIGGGPANWNKGLVDQAIADVTTVIKLGPPQAKAYNIRGSFYLSKGDTARAIGDFTEAIRLAPNDPTIYNNRGAAYLTAENLTRAIDDLSEAIRLDPHMLPPLRTAALH